MEHRMRGVLFDLDGVFYEGKVPVPGASAVVSWFIERKIPHLFLTNTTSRPRSALVEKLSAMGVPVASEQLVTPAVVAQAWLKRETPGPVALFVPDATKVEFSELPLLPETVETGAGAVVVGDLGEAWDFRTLNRAFRLLIAEPAPALLALGMTRYWRASDGLRLDVAPFIKALEHASGLSARVLGKPAEDFFRIALDRLQCGPNETIVVGDDIRADIEAAQKMGVRGVLVRTGKYRPSDLQQGITPFAILDSVAEFPDWWQEHVEA